MKNWLEKNTKDDTTMLRRKFIGIFVKRTGHAPEGALGNEEIKVLWDKKYSVWQSHRGKTTWPNSYWQERTKWDNYWYYVPADVRVEEKDKENVEKYQDLKKEIKRLWKLRNVEIVLVVIGALGTVSAEFDRWMVKLGITCSVGVMQKTALLVTARILRKVLDRRNDGNNSSQNINVQNK